MYLVKGDFAASCSAGVNPLLGLKVTTATTTATSTPVTTASASEASPATCRQWDQLKTHVGLAMATDPKILEWQPQVTLLCTIKQSVMCTSLTPYAYLGAHRAQILTYKYGAWQCQLCI